MCRFVNETNGLAIFYERNIATPNQILTKIVNILLI